MYICICNAITEKDVRASVDAGACTLGDLQFKLGVATCCGACAAMASEYLPGGRCHEMCGKRAIDLPIYPLAATLGEDEAPVAQNYPIIQIRAA